MTKVAALLMAAGNSRRMGGPNKLLQVFKGKALVEHAVIAIAEANFAHRILVTGRDHESVEKLCLGFDFEIVHNPRFVEGFGTSLATGFMALQNMPEVEGALVMLADMPLISAHHLNQLVEAFVVAKGQNVIRAAYNNQAGNPVIIPKILFAEMAKLDGEQSGQQIIKTSGLKVELIEIGPAALMDIDTPEAFALLQEAVL